jgi:hypothetical protein
MASSQEVSRTLLRTRQASDKPEPNAAASGDQHSFVMQRVVELGKAAIGAAMIDIRCGRCDRHGRLSVKRLLATPFAD